MNRDFENKNLNNEGEEARKTLNYNGSGKAIDKPQLSEDDSETKKDNNLYIENMERGAYNYIKKERSYLITSGIMPLFTAIVSFINIRFILFALIHKLFLLGRLIDLIMPMLVLLIIAIFMIIQFLFLEKWNSKVKHYELQKKLLSSAEKEEQKLFNSIKTRERNKSDSGENNHAEYYSIRSKITLTNLFYDIIEHMENIKKFFILLNILSIIYLIWGFDFFIIGIPINISNHLYKLIWNLNFIAFLLLIFYISFEWVHFIKWYKKLKAVKDFEKKIYEELGISRI